MPSPSPFGGADGASPAPAGYGGLNAPYGMSPTPGGGAANRDNMVVRFKSDKTFMTADELNAKQRQARELQDALEAQIQEKRRQKVRRAGWGGAMPATGL